MPTTVPAVLIALYAGLAAPGAAPAATLGDTLLSRLEENQRFDKDLTCRVRLVQEKAGQGTKTTDLEYFRRDSDESFLIHQLSPESERGNGYLRTGDNLWMYRRNTRSFQHINRDESIGGSDAKADDFETRNITETYMVARDKDGKEAIREENLGKVPVYRVEVEAKVHDVDYARKIWWISRDKNLLMKEEAYSKKTLMQTVYYFKYTQIEGRYIPVKLMFVDEFEKGSRTVGELSHVSTKMIEGAIFTKAHLESLSK